MKILFLIFFLFSTIFADEFDVEESGTVVFPMTKKEIREFIPLVPRMLTKEELAKKRKLEAKKRAEKERVERIRKAKIAENFTDKSQLKEVKKKDVKVKVDTKEVDFFDSLDGAEKKAIDIEK